MKKDYLKDITLVLISYKSEDKIKSFIKKIPKELKVIIVENFDKSNVQKIIKKQKNIKIFKKKNNGVASSLNFAVKKIKTKYFIQISPDIKFNYRSLETFTKEAKNLNQNFAAIGPRFINVNPKSHIQINKKLKTGSISSIHGSFLFVNTKKFKEIGCYDDNIFLYFEETDYCKRGALKKLKSFQINTVKVKQEGRSVVIKDNKEEKKMKNLLAWHFIWSKFYYYNKHYGYIYSIMHFLPILIRILFKLLIKRKGTAEFEKYKYRFDGLISSALGKKSYLRP
jgi:N-acetylglucosaminyl-diphospho-decaprenol L-rhamnosyltransferase